MGEHSSGDGSPVLSWQTVLTSLVIVIGLAASQWGMFQLQIANLERQITVYREASETRDELARKAIEQHVGIQEFNEYKSGTAAQLKLLGERVTITEATRPTTGELRSVTDQQSNRIDKLYQLWLSIDEWLRTHSAPQKEQK